MVFSACGGLCTRSKLPVLTAYFPVNGLRASWERVDCSTVEAPPLEDGITGIESAVIYTGILYYTGFAELQLISSSVADCLTLT